MQNIVVGFNSYHKRNILCWEISATFEFCCLRCECAELHAPSSSGLDELLVTLMQGFPLLIVCTCSLYKCPLCNTSMVDMTEHWKRLDEEKKEWPMPRRYRNFTVQVSDVLLNDRGEWYVSLRYSARIVMRLVNHKLLL